MLNIESGIAKYLEPMRKLYPCHVNRISGLDDNCLRRLYYHRAAWDKKDLPSIYLQGIFETGNMFEPVVLRAISSIGELNDVPFRIVGTQLPTNDNLLKQYQISGTIDGLLQTKENGKWVTKGAVDIKTSSPNIVGNLNNYADLAKYPWTKKYRGQLQLYSLAHNLDYCYILFVNKTNLFDMKFVEFPVDMEYCEELLQKADAVNKAIVSNEPPEKINDPDDCPSCPYNSICMPEYTAGGNLQISEDEELAGILERLDELEQTAKEINDLEKMRDTLLIKGQDIVCGNFLVLWKEITGNRKPTAGGEYSYWRKKIIKH